MNPEDVEKLLRRFEPPPIPAELDRRIVENARQGPTVSREAVGAESAPRLKRIWGTATLAASFFFVALALWAVLWFPRPEEIRGDPSVWEARRARLDREAVPILPTAAELRWQGIPWMTDLAEALRVADREKRPLLVWMSFRDPLDRACGSAAWLRVGPLSDEEVVRRVSSGFVPVALDHRTAPKGDDAAGRLMKVFNGDPKECIGVWIVSPEGKILARPTFESKVPSATQELLRVTDPQIAGPFTPRAAPATDPLPYRGKGVRPDGSATLALSSRLMRRSGEPDGPMVLASVDVPAEEWASLAPPRIEPGAEWALPESLARRCALALVPHTDGAWTPQPHEIRIAVMTAAVEAVVGGRALVRLHGRWEAEQSIEVARRLLTASATAEGTAEIDLDARAPRSVRLVFSGLISEVAPAARPRATGAVLEWQRREDRQ